VTDRTAENATARRPSRSLRPHRSTTDRIVAGVAGGLGEQLGVDPVVLRLSFVVLSFAGGFGMVLYLGLWLAGTEGTSAPPRRASSDARQVVAVALVVAGMLLLLREAGLWFGDGITISVGLAAFGSALIWTRSDDAARGRLSRMAARLPRAQGDEGVSRVRLLAGAVLIVGGMAAFLAANNVIRSLGQVAVAVAVTAAGLGLILGPWMVRLGRQLTEERRRRIRSEERAEVAAHLHDSVLQTLALIQRSSDPAEMGILARGQERELRAWLYGRTGAGSNGGDLLSVALDEAAGRIERLHRIPVEVVTVGDCPMDNSLRSLVEAAAEGMSNAARHSGAAVVSVYAEVGPEDVRVYVRDQGSGFDLAAVPAGRRGIAESIEGRMHRHGGSATIGSEPGEGTEVFLSMPRRAA